MVEVLGLAAVKTYENPGMAEMDQDNPTPSNFEIFYFLSQNTRFFDTGLSPAFKSVYGLWGSNPRQNKDTLPPLGPTDDTLKRHCKSLCVPQ